MSDSHFTCDDGSMLTRACRKPPSVAFASHLFSGKSGTYSKPLRRGRMKRLVLAGALAVVAAGWTAGAGVEAAFGENVTARTEYLYIKLQNGGCTIAAT